MKFNDRFLIVARGFPGSGKSRFFDAAYLKNHTISPDTLRSLIASPVLDDEGNEQISQEYNTVVWNRVTDMTDERMSRAELVCLDATFVTNDGLKPFQKLADKWGYNIVLVDFTKLDVDMIKERNADRPYPYRVPDHSMDRMIELSKNFVVPKDVIYLEVKSKTLNFRDDIHNLKNIIRMPIINGDEYRNIHHIGDLQGCATVLRDNIQYNKEDLFIFAGDLIDRGAENAEVIKYMSELCKNDNVLITFGNHETHLWRWYKDMVPVSRVFRNETLPQFEAGGVTREDLEPIFNRVRKAVFYEKAGQKVIVCHAGIPSIPSRPELVPGVVYTSGNGDYAQDIDFLFSKNQMKLPEASRWIQVHGHRNGKFYKADEYPYSVNLEDSVEFGGNLRISTLKKDGEWEHKAHKNRIIVPYHLRSRRESDIIVPWIGKSNAIEQAVLDTLRHHKMENGKSAVRAMNSVSFPNIYSFNFTKDVFFDKAWDEIVNRARGFFVNTNTLEVTCRSYDKFFNIGERPETHMDFLVDNLEFPLTGWLKENGFLGIVGYDSETDSLVVTSKSTPDSDFAKVFNDMLVEHLGKNIEPFKRMLRDLGCSITFEVVHPEFDPHIIKYAKPTLVMLDVIRRSDKFEKAPYEVTKQVADRYKFECKKKMLYFANKAAFAGWYKKASQNEDNKIEGVVFEDASGYQVKWKSPYYQFWKYMRGMKDAIASGREIKYLYKLEGKGRDFYYYCCLQDKESLKTKDIITMRDEFEKFLDVNSGLFYHIDTKYDALEDVYRRFTTEFESYDRAIKRGKPAVFKPLVPEHVNNLGQESKAFYDFLIERVDEYTATGKAPFTNYVNDIVLHSEYNNLSAGMRM